jgi:hypothetical protein
VALYKIRSSRVNNIAADQYAGSSVEEGLIWYDPNTGILRLYNGEPGGYIINHGSGGPTNQISDGDSNVVVNSDGRVSISVNGVANVAVFEGPQAQFDNVVSSGNVTANYFIGDGSQLTGITVQVPGVFGLVIDGGNAAVASSDFIVDGGGA